MEDVGKLTWIYTGMLKRHVAKTSTHCLSLIRGTCFSLPSPSPPIRTAGSQGVSPAEHPDSHATRCTVQEPICFLPSASQGMGTGGNDQPGIL